MYRIALLSVLMILIVTTSNSQSKNGEFRVEISDPQLATIIRKYIEETRTDIKHRVITIRVVTGDKKCVTITNEISDTYKIGRFAPTNYGVLDNKVLVLIYAPIDNLFKRNLKGITREIDHEIRKLEIKLTHIDDGTLSSTYSARTWRLTEEGRGFRLNKNVSPHELDVIPPGYAIVRDSVDLDSLLLIKQ